MCRNKIAHMENPFQELKQDISYLKELLELRLPNLLPAKESENDFLSIDQAASLLNLAKQTVYALSSAAKIPVIKKGKRLYFCKKELIAWMRKGRRKTTQEIEEESAEYIIKNKILVRR